MKAHNVHYLPSYLNDRRSGKERRKFSYTLHIPERRTENDRRSGLERRTGIDRRLGPERRKILRQMTNKPERGDESTGRDIMLE